ncbi:MAG: recombination protein RecR [Candidatus Wallbacteria bacterium]|nr:recombination protein RecR [Candidatus Wallbacteria bacterium]
MQYPPALARLIAEFARYPGIGPKTAERLAFFTLGRQKPEVDAFAQALAQAVERLHPCVACGALAEHDLCPVCVSPKRDRSRICVVERQRDVYVFERSGVFDGLYHVLGGVISPLDGIGPEELRVSELIERVRPGEVHEVILASTPSTEGETTGLFLAQTLASLPVTVTRIAYGVPLGSDLEFADPATLARALEARRPLKV